MGELDDSEILGVEPTKAADMKKPTIDAINNPELFLSCPVFILEILSVEEKNMHCFEYPSRSAGLPPLSPSRTVHATFTAHGSCNSINYFLF